LVYILVRLYNDNINQKEIDRIVEMLRDGAVIIFPPDTIYGIGCDITLYYKIFGDELIDDQLSFIDEDEE